MNGSLVARILNVTSNHKCAPLTFSQYGTLVLSTVTNYMNSGYEQFSKHFVPMNRVAEIERKKKLLIPKTVLRNIYADAQLLWSKMVDQHDPTYMTHDTYLKLYALSRPSLAEYDVIMLDESQDSNGVLLSIISSARAQQIYVGDKYQQIYSWRGATNAMDCITTPNTCNLSQSFRFGPKIAALASGILQNELGSDVPIKGFDAIEDELCVLEKPDCMIFRTNAGLIGEALRQIEQSRKVCIVGDVGALILLIDGIRDLEETGRSTHPELMDFESYIDFLEYTDTDTGKDLAVIVRLVSEHGYAGLKAALVKVKENSEADSDIILTTAHKSKGREWDTVKLGDDYRYIEDLTAARLSNKDFPFNAEEFNLLYVAITRAKKKLDVSALNYFNPSKNAKVVIAR